MFHVPVGAGVVVVVVVKSCPWSTRGEDEGMEDEVHPSVCARGTSCSHEHTDCTSTRTWDVRD